MSEQVISAVKPSRRYTGLSNQGATCYMNSLLQTLYMSPEFRRVLFTYYRFNPNGDCEASQSIPFQLQILFAQMQSSGARSISTKVSHL